MEAYLAEVRKMEKQFLGLELQGVPRGTNKEADDIATRASKLQLQEPGVFEDVRTPIPSHIDLAGNTSYHLAASRTVFPRVSPYHGPGPFAPFGSRI